MSDTKQSMVSGESELSPRASINLGSIIVEKIELTMFKIESPHQEDDPQRAIEIETHRGGPADLSRQVSEVRSVQTAKIADVPRQIVFAETGLKFSIERNSTPNRIDLDLSNFSFEAQDSNNREKITIHGTVFDEVRDGGNTIRIRRERLPLKGIVGYETEQTLYLVDLKRNNVDTEYYVLVPNFDEGPPEADLQILDQNNSKFYLKWPLEKLGDGTYGIVYKAHNGRKDYAVKILYDRQFSTRTGMFSLHLNDLQLLDLDLVDFRSSATDNRVSVHFSDLIEKTFASISKKIDNAGGDPKEIVRAGHSNLQKILRSSDQSTNLSQSRFKHESEVTEKIHRYNNDRKKKYLQNRDHFPEDFIEHLPSNYVEVVASTASFRDQPAFKELQKNYSEIARKEVSNLSDYAIIMEYCTYTLKDLLERGWVVSVSSGVPVIRREREGEIISGNLVRSPVPTARIIGYDLIKFLPYRERIKACAPFLLGVARGLLTLHSAEILHHDVKPGNVFLRVSRDSFEVLLGDFSFVAQAAQKGSTEAVFKDVASTGTPHFRSPEQRDFSEVYQAQISHAYEGVRQFALRISDPKFDRNKPSPQDRIVFSSDQSGALYTVKDIKNDKSRVSWTILLQEDSEELCRSFSETSKTTQIYIYKVPTIKSDVFGFGALAYDLISAGKSAERFYELLRSVDYDNSSKTLDKIIQEYKKYIMNVDAYVGDSGLVEIFNKFKSEIYRNDFCSPEMVSLIIKCMATKIDGSYIKDTKINRRISDETKFLEIQQLLFDIDKDISDRRNLLINPPESLQWKFIEEHHLVSGKQQEESDSNSVSVLADLWNKAVKPFK